MRATFNNASQNDNKTLYNPYKALNFMIQIR
jgi:hypothetical protein